MKKIYIIYTPYAYTQILPYKAGIIFEIFRLHFTVTQHLFFSLTTIYRIH